MISKQYVHHLVEPYVSDKRIEERLKSLMISKKEKTKASKLGVDIDCASFFNLSNICTCKCKVWEIETKIEVKNLLQLPQRKTNPLSKYSAIGLTLCLDCFIL